MIARNSLGNPGFDLAAVVDAGLRIGDYQLDGLVGEGVSSQCWEGYEASVSDKHRYAVKVVVGSETRVDGAATEAKKLVPINHDHVIRYVKAVRFRIVDDRTVQWLKERNAWDTAEQTSIALREADLERFRKIRAKDFTDPVLTHAMVQWQQASRAEFTHGVAIVLELADATLADYIDQHPDRRLSLSETVAVGRQIAAGVVEIHRKAGGTGSAHMDLKTDNLFMVGDTIKVGDLGLPSRYDEVDGNDGLPEVPSYTGPSEEEPWHPKFHGVPGALTGRRSGDVHCIGRILHECATGQSPFMLEGKALSEGFRRRYPSVSRAFSETVPLRVDDANYGNHTGQYVAVGLGEIGDIIEWCLDPTNEYKTAAELLHRLQSLDPVGLNGTPPLLTVEEFHEGHGVAVETARQISSRPIRDGDILEERIRFDKLFAVEPVDPEVAADPPPADPRPRSMKIRTKALSVMAVAAFLFASVAATDLVGVRSSVAAWLDGTDPAGASDPEPTVPVTPTPAEVAPRATTPVLVTTPAPVTIPPAPSPIAGSNDPLATTCPVAFDAVDDLCISTVPNDLEPTVCDDIAPQCQSGFQCPPGNAVITTSPEPECGEVLVLRSSTAILTADRHPEGSYVECPTPSGDFRAEVDDWLNVRAGAGTQYDRVGFVTPDTSDIRAEACLQGADASDPWIKIEERGWVYGQYLMSAQDEAAEVEDVDPDPSPQPREPGCPSGFDGPVDSACTQVSDAVLACAEGEFDGTSCVLRRSQPTAVFGSRCGAGFNYYPLQDICITVRATVCVDPYSRRVGNECRFQNPHGVPAQQLEWSCNQSGGLAKYAAMNLSGSFVEYCYYYIDSCPPEANLGVVSGGCGQTAQPQSVGCSEGLDLVTTDSGQQTCELRSARVYSCVEPAVLVSGNKCRETVPASA